MFCWDYFHYSIWTTFRAHQESADGVHQRPARGAGEGVPLQPLPVSAPEDRNGRPSQSHRAPNQDLVPEQTNEVQEGTASEAALRQMQA